MRLSAIAALGLLVAGGAVGGVRAGDDHGSADPEAALVQKGRVLYMHHCSHCHGFNLVNPGTITPDLRQFPRDQKTRFLETIALGKNSRMPAWGDVLTLEDVDALWAYIGTGGRS